MDRLSAMRTFICVVEERSFSGAAKRIGLANATVTASIKSLEKHLGAQLLNRTTRHVSATNEGKRYFERARAILAEINEIERQSPARNGPRAVAAEGCDLHLAARSIEQLDAAKKILMADYGVTVTTHVCDLSATDAMVKLAGDVGAVDILVNNAGSIPSGRIDEIDDERWRRAWDLKVFGYITLTREMYARMRARGSGVIINIIGLSGERHRPQYIAGTSGNAALMAFTRALGAESVDYGIRVVGVNPGRVETERQIAHLKDGAEKLFGGSGRWTELRAQMNDTLPFKRSARPDEVSDLVTFLASDRASYMSATVVTLDAGQSLRLRVN